MTLSTVQEKAWLLWHLCGGAGDPGRLPTVVLSQQRGEAGAGEN